MKGKDVLFVADKGYYKNQLFEDMVNSNIKFIIPLPRDEKRIDYNRKLDEVTEYHDRIIRYTKYADGKYHLYLYEDQLLKYEETTEYYQLKLVEKEVSFREEWAGRITRLSNIEEDPKQAYLMWKTREEIEKSFHILQNVLEVDTPHVSKEEVFKGYVFASFIALYLYYKVLNLLQKKDLNQKVSVADLMFELSKIMLNEKNNTLLEAPTRTWKLANKAGLTNIITKNEQS